MKRRALLLTALFLSAPAGAACLDLSDGDAVQAPHGYIVRSLNAFIRHEDAMPSGDDRYWICASPDGLLALYAPRDPMEDEPEHDE